MERWETLEKICVFYVLHIIIRYNGRHDTLVRTKPRRGEQLLAGNMKANLGYHGTPMHNPVTSRAVYNVKYNVIFLTIDSQIPSDRDTSQSATPPPRTPAVPRHFWAAFVFLTRELTAEICAILI
jgi:hypothetical protein